MGVGGGEDTASGPGFPCTRVPLSMQELVYSVSVLSLWWATWTLADTYLIPFTPVSELVVALMGCLGLLYPRVRAALGRRVSDGATKLEEAIERL